jgi:6-pyruvoyltetrahydropterin/6-carboxytetrahydropterin synthase
MLELTRAVRFCINPNSGSQTESESHNTFAASPSMRGLGRYYELEVTCRGEVDPVSGYFLNIKVIDKAVRGAAVPVIARACEERPTAWPEAVVGEVLDSLRPSLGAGLLRVRWRLTPYYSVEMSTAAANKVYLRQQFDFAASHRLHCPSLSDDENRRLFGKCNHPGGHGHNYRVEPCVEMDAPPAGAAPALTLADLERITDEVIIDRYDHKHLNDDTPEFASGGGDRPAGLNPSVENIAKVCYERLSPEIARASNNRARLHSITVWETDKTSCRYPV